jgi:hypothetical protein
MKILTLLTLMAAAYFVAPGNQHAGCASVIAADGRVWNNVRMDWTLAGDFHLSDTTGHRITTLPEMTTHIRTRPIPGISGFLVGFSSLR